MPQSKLSPSRSLSGLRSRLLTWFDRHRRELPWRRDRDPYRIWVSEVMLQQTTVATVAPRFVRFMQSFPTIRQLALADEQEILRHWEGLGYYRRARHLHRAAQIFVEEHGGELPDDPAVWAGMPGVGRYILGAVLSQAFDQKLPIVEANSKRVLCRLFGQKLDPNSAVGIRWLWETAESLLPRKRIGDFNQAVMELGALVCTPSAPDCGRCPAASACIARREGLQEALPVRPPPPTPQQVREAAVVPRDGSRVFLVQRPEGGRWPNMWEFPHGPLEAGESVLAAARRLLKTLLGMNGEIGFELLTLKHSVTRFRITMTCLEAKYRAGEFASAYYKQGRWLEPCELTSYPVSSPQRKLAQELARNSRQLRLL